MIIASVGGSKRHESNNVTEPGAHVRAAPLADRSEYPHGQQSGHSAAGSTYYPTPLRLHQIAHQRIQYPVFRESFFYDETVNPALKGNGWEPDAMSTVRESRKLWSSNGRSISSRLPKTAMTPGSAFRNECFSPDRLYSSSKSSLGYEVTRSLRGSSLCSTTRRFDAKTTTPDNVGPGSYNVLARNRPVLHVPSTEINDPKHSERLREWGNAPADPRSMDSAGEWKFTSEKPSPAAYSFRKAPSATWIEQVEQRQRRFNPEAHAPPSRLKSSAEERLPNYLQGVRNPVRTKHAALTALADDSGR
uniref:Uncharacterized protein n=1 Tax=Globisporangium ultimum (strain ATCC 200006 / CBS 805.95 / DAOM BR144) TaxID=431595 RepID=K3XBM0_GLOUD